MNESLSIKKSRTVDFIIRPVGVLLKIIFYKSEGMTELS